MDSWYACNEITKYSPSIRIKVVSTIRQDLIDLELKKNKEDQSFEIMEYSKYKICEYQDKR